MPQTGNLCAEWLRTLDKITGTPFTPILDIAQKCCLARAHSILRDPTHHHHELFFFLSSGKKFHSILTKIARPKLSTHPLQTDSHRTHIPSNLTDPLSVQYYYSCTISDFINRITCIFSFLFSSFQFNVLMLQYKYFVYIL